MAGKFDAGRRFWEEEAYAVKGVAGGTCQIVQGYIPQPQGFQSINMFDPCPVTSQ